MKTKIIRSKKSMANLSNRRSFDGAAKCEKLSKDSKVLVKSKG
jgi:hypothetical protein